MIAWFSGATPTDALSLDAKPGRGHIEATIAPHLVSGTIAFEDGVARRFFAVPAGDGAGIYEVTVDRSGHMRGRSQHGDRFSVRPDGLFAAGTLTTAAGRRFKLHIGDLVRNLRYGIRANPPDSYRAILAPRGRFIFGRSCWPRDCNTNIIGLDKAC